MITYLISHTVVISNFFTCGSVRYATSKLKYYNEHYSKKFSHKQHKIKLNLNQKYKFLCMFIIEIKPLLFSMQILVNFFLYYSSYSQ